MDVKNPDEILEFTNLITGVSEYYGKKISASSIKVMMLGLQIYPIRDIKRACSIHLKNPDNGQFMPKVADIVRIIDGDTESQAGGGWVKADKALRIQGPYRDVCFDDPIIHKVIDDMGGWINFCTRSDENNYQFQQKEFERRYQGYAGRPLIDYPKLLTGLATHQNGYRGIKHRELPALIGNPERAMEVYRLGIDPGSRDNSKAVSFARLISKMESSAQPLLENKTDED